MLQLEKKRVPTAMADVCIQYVRKRRPCDEVVKNLKHGLPVYTRLLESIVVQVLGEMSFLKQSGAGMDEPSQATGKLSVSCNNRQEGL